MRNKTEAVGATELRMRFAQSRANALQAQADAINLRMEKLFKRQLAIAKRAHQFSEQAAGLRGLIGIAREKGADRMRFENGSVIFLSPKHVHNDADGAEGACGECISKEVR